MADNIEEWKVIDGYERYEVSSFGRVRKSGYILSSIDVFSKGWYSVNLYKDSKPHSTPIHKLVARAFRENPNNYDVVNHIDKNKTNNKHDNLSWCAIRQSKNKASMRKHNTSGVTGIARDKNSWRAKWCDNEGKQKSKSFSIVKFGDDEAKTLAIEWRKARELEFGYL